MKNENLTKNKEFKDKFLKEILGLNENEANETVFMLKSVVSPEVMRRLEYFTEYILQNEQFIVQFKERTNSMNTIF